MNSFQNTNNQNESAYIPSQMISEDMVNNSTKIKPRVKNFKHPKANYTKLQNYKKVIKIDEIINQNSSVGFEQK